MHLMPEHLIPKQTRRKPRLASLKAPERPGCFWARVTAVKNGPDKMVSRQHSSSNMLQFNHNHGKVANSCFIFTLAAE